MVKSALSLIIIHIHDGKAKKFKAIVKDKKGKKTVVKHHMAKHFLGRKNAGIHMAKAKPKGKHKGIKSVSPKTAFKGIVALLALVGKKLPIAKRKK